MVSIVGIPSGRPASRVARLNDLSVRRFRDVDELSGAVGDGQVIPDELLSVDGLGLHLSDEQKRILAREEIASIVLVGLNFEAVLGTGFCYAMATLDPARSTGPEVVYSLHQLGEETRHSRVFIDMLEQLQPAASNPFAAGPLRRARGAFVRWTVTKPLFFQTLVLGGEEIPDLVQRLVAEHPESDPHLAAVAAYHRAEEARHMVFARLSFPGHLEAASMVDRAAVRWLTPLALWSVWDSLVHPGVYEQAGLPPWRTWAAVRRLPARVELRQRATRPVLDALVEAGVLRADRLPRAWRALCGIERAAS